MGTKKKILFTGGGSAGHVTLNLALIPLFLDEGWEVIYVGSKTGIEKGLIERLGGVKYFPISTGKLRRYFSFQNFLDTFKILFGISQAFFIIYVHQPNLIFSKGGFVSFPVVFAGWLNIKKIFLHESDITLGLANKISLPFVSRLFTTFEETKNYIKKNSRIEYLGAIVSDRLKNGDRIQGLNFCAFNDDNRNPIILVFGGSLGAVNINNAVRKNLDLLLTKYKIVHICGKDKIDRGISKNGYKQFEFINEEFKDVMAMADIVISRAGSNSIFELLYLKKPMLLIPLPRTASRGEQSLNAKSFYDKGYCEIIEDENLINSDLFIEKVNSVFENKNLYVANMAKANFKTTNNNLFFKHIKQELGME